MDEPEPWLDLSRLIEDGSQDELAQFIDGHTSADLTLSISHLTQEQQDRLLDRLPAERAADLLEQLPDVLVVELVESIEPQVAAAIIDRLPSNEQADLIGDLSASQAEAILREMDPVEAAETRTLSRYEDDVAGGLMITEYLQYNDKMTVGQVVADLRADSEKYRDYSIQYAYVCKRGGRLIGVLRLRDLLLAGASLPITDLMIREPHSVRDDTELEDLVDFFHSHHYLGVPVVDVRGVLVGVARRAAIDDAWNAKHDSDYLKTQGIVGGDEIRTMPFFRRSSRRLSWLSINIVLNVISASVIAAYQDTLAAVISLAVFLPIISDMSGCSGNQAVAVSMRELELGLVRSTEIVRVWLKEVFIGLFNGVILGTLIGLIAYLWQGNEWLGFVVGLALCLNTILAVSIGGMIPLLLKRFGIDPAIASSPILTTLTDMCGFLLVLGFATLWLSRLAG